MDTIIFNNKTAKNEIVIRCDPCSVKNILDWYENFYSGDDYTFTHIVEDPAEISDLVSVVMAALIWLFIGILISLM